MTVIEIVKKYLTENGYDGLYNSDSECGCTTKDVPLCEACDLCEAGYFQHHKAPTGECDGVDCRCIGELKCDSTPPTTKVGK